jgi:hypothetical protein
MTGRNGRLHSLRKPLLETALVGRRSVPQRPGMGTLLLLPFSLYIK